jgi:hypothetical protein
LDRFGGGNIGKSWLWEHGRLGRLTLLLGGCGNLLGLKDALLWLAFIALNGLLLFLEETEDVVEDKVTIRLLGEEESLNEFLPRLATVGHFTDHLNDDATVGRGLRIN